MSPTRLGPVTVLLAGILLTACLTTRPLPANSDLDAHSPRRHPDGGDPARGMDRPAYLRFGQPQALPPDLRPLDRVPDAYRHGPFE